ncbi:hypothetical protein [Hufsiella ginkgonis]|uniref:Alpha-L-arabinofuranosidase n=1 Tax=Hufsiella ginkgonis TaxID=2695274 RepID=A0A7K1XS08_9SPHI|nr:hypothetical protein [Hufsiella ginkgonis]MXV13781.1 hypothetical protein [Hufsiella ginkgonis]
MGFNIVYCYEGDKAWDSGSGKVGEEMRRLNVGQYRYPGGTVVTKYHWERPTGQGWKDTWDPSFDASKNTGPSTFMDIDEYLELVKKHKTDALVGINMGSGMKYNRVQDGVDEAIRLMKHCISKGVKVKYYYLDNEPYQPDANFTYTPEQYADMVNIYVPAMKKIDPGIKIIVNTQPRTDAYIRPLLKKAGKNIDYVDVHMYWKWRNATFANWTSEPAMTHQGKGSYEQQRGIWEKVFAEEGFSNIRLVVLEWNIGPSPVDAAPTHAEAALMVSEQFTQYIRSGLFMSCFWPLSWPQSDWTARGLYPSQKTYEPLEMYRMFSSFSSVLGQSQVADSHTGTRLTTLSVRSNDGKTVWIYLINKHQETERVIADLKIEGMTVNQVAAVWGFDRTGRELGRELLLPGKKGSGFQINVPKNAFVKLTIR